MIDAALRSLMASTTCADLAAAVQVIQGRITAAELRADFVVAQRWQDVLEELWPRYAEASEFVVHWSMILDLSDDNT